MKNAQFIAEKKANFGNYVLDLFKKYKISNTEAEQLVNQQIIKSAPESFILQVVPQFLPFANNPDNCLNMFKTMIDFKGELQKEESEKLKKYFQCFVEVVSA